MIGSATGLMEQSGGSSPRIRFGAFEVDLPAGELRQRGVKVKVQQQPFEVLAALLERPGSVVTREELQRRIWSAQTFGDFERGLNKAINRLRDALGDSPDTPRFIETLPRRGYRFIAPVERTIGSIAVLPLENLSGDSSLDYWADGITDELITHLAKLSELRVISRTSVMRFKNTRVPLAEIARELGVDAVIEGSVVVSDRTVRIRAQLVGAAPDRHLWAESYERELGDIVIVQEQIAKAIGAQILARLTPDQESRFSKARSVNPDAYDAYLRGRFFWNKRTAPDLDKSFEYFNQAIALDTGYAKAYAGLADYYITLGILALRPPREVYPPAKDAAETALELDETLAEAHNSLAAARHHYGWDWAGAEQEFKRALELDPNCSVAHQWYGALLALMRRYEEAIIEVKRARDLDPLSLVLNAFVGFMHMLVRQHDQAVDATRKAIELDPLYPFGHYVLARCLDARGELGHALEESEAAAGLSGGDLPFLAHLGYANARIGNLVKARDVREQLRELSKTTYVSPYHVARIYTGLGEKDSAFEWLERAFEERTARLPTELQGDPAFDGLRDDPRFEDLVRRMGLPS